MQSNLDELEQVLGYRFSNRPLLSRAVTHSSSANEAQAAEISQTPEGQADNERLYILIGENGPGHARTFTVEVRVGKDMAASAEGPSKKAASHNAAFRVCQLLRGEVS